MVRPQPTTYLGSKELHRRHSVMVEGGLVPRAKVMDQQIFDAYLMRGELNLAQHQAAEHILGLAVRAKLWPTGVNWSGTRVSGGNRNFVPFGAFPFGRKLVSVKRRFGVYHMYILQEVVVYDQDVSGDDKKMQVLREALDWIASRRTGVHRSPVWRLEEAAEKKKTADNLAVALAGGE